MSEELRKQLAERLHPKPKQGLQTSKSAALIPKLSTSRTISQTNLTRLQPLSPYIKMAKSPKTELGRLKKRDVEEKLVRSRKVQLPPIAKNAPIRAPVHGDGRLLREEDIVKRTQQENPTTYDLIQTIKHDPELVDDFWYCNRKDDAYDFETVPFKKRNPVEYLTISSRGVTHFSKGDAYFLSIDDWEREYKIYQKLKQINFFKQYKMWKNFSLWKNIRRQNMISQMGTALQQNLLILDEQFRSSIFEVREYSWTILKFEIVDFNMDKVRTIEAFNADQDTQRESVANELENIENKIKHLVLKACRNSLEEFRVTHNINTNADDPARLIEDDAYPFLKGDLSNKHMPYTHESMKRTHYKRITRFIRFCDYQIIDAKLALSLSCVEKILKSLKMEKRLNKRHLGTQNSYPLLCIDANFEGLKIYFEPDNEAVKVAVDDTILRGLTMLLNNYMLVNTKDFDRYTKALDDYEEKPSEEEFELLQMVVCDSKIKKIEKEIKETIDFSFTKVTNFANRYTPFLRQYGQNKQMKIEAYKDQDSEAIKAAIDEYQNQIENFNEMAEEEDLGIFQLRTERIKSEILPSPKNCLSKMYDFLPQVALESANSLTAFLTEANKNLRGTPKNVEEYVWHHKCVREIEERIGDVTDKVNELKDLMQLMESYSIPCGEQVKRRYNDTLTCLDTLKQKTMSFHERAESDQIRFTRELRDKIKQTDKRVAEINTRLADERFANKESSTASMVQILNEIGETLEVLVADTEAYNKYQVELDIDRKEFATVKETQKDFDRKISMWRALHEWDHKIIIWNESAFVDIDVAQISKEVNSYYDIAKKSWVLEDQGNYVPQMLMAKVEVLKDTMPVVVDLRCESLLERHWVQLREILDTDIDVHSSDFKLKDLLAMKVNDKKDKIAAVALRARKEEEISKELETLVRSWDSVELSYAFIKADDHYLLVDVEEITSQLDETMVKLIGLLTNRFVGPLAEQVDNQCKRFKLFSSTFDEWLLCQKQWAELKKIFTNTDISKKMKDKHKKFMSIDNQYQNQMKFLVDKSALAFPACTKEGLLKTFQDWNKTLEKLQKSLEEYLDKQRNHFPRLYFLSNDELTRLLSVAHNQKDVQPFLKNIFENIYELSFDEDKSKSINAIISAEKEAVKLTTTTKANGNIEEWLRILENSMQSSLKQRMQDAYKDYAEMPRKAFIMAFPSQIVAVVSMIMWCFSIEEALNSRETETDTLTEMAETTNNNLSELTQIVKEELEPHIRRRVTAMAIQDVHNRDVIEMLREDDAASISDFKWQKQLKYYWNPTVGDCFVNHMNAEYTYSYEFLGATSRLVITPLTDRCWMTITLALQMNLGANPTGPAGTGKTESTKDLAKALGKYCIVFNCSEQVTYLMMEKLFMGLCSTGSWSCLDEFNRIDTEVLSVIAQQLRSIKNAKDEGKSEFFFEDKRTVLKNKMGVFITMNPGYVGRTELPDNLKVLFRPISMMVPKYNLIAEIMLLSEGFRDAKRLSRKMTQLYKLCSEQLSQQDHYDFGLRAIKTVLNMAGSHIRKDPWLPEDVILIKAMREANLPKFLKNDKALFEAIVNDLFPDNEMPPMEDTEFISAIRQAMTNLNYQSEDLFIRKVMQLFQTTEVRFGVMIIGPAASGKSGVYRTLAEAMGILRAQNARNPSYQPVVYQALNPKSIEMGELFGQFNAVTQDWKDGIASAIMREYAKKEGETRHWVVFDGPVDSLWVENMNTVLDDNMMLCLANQERLKLRKEMKALFEVLDLSAASPATVSRCGMVYIDSDILSWKAIAKSWTHKNLSDWPEENFEYFWHLVTTYVPKALHTVRKNLHELITTINNSLVISFCNLFRALTERSPRLNDEFIHFKKYIDKAFVFALIWSIGGSLDNYSMGRFDVAMSSELSLDLPKGSLYDSFIEDHKIGGEYKTWASVMPDFQYSPDFHSIVVPTRETVAYGHLLKYAMSVGKPIFFTGRTGAGKSVIARTALDGLKEENIYVINLTFSAHTTSVQTQDALVGKLEHKRKDVMGGPGSKRVALLVDDVNMPALERYGSQPPVELLRQFCDHGFIYDRQKRALVNIIDTTLICCAGPPDGGRNPLTPRFTRHFHLLSIPDNREDTMNLIFKSILDKFFNIGFNNEAGSTCEAIVKTAISCFEVVYKCLLPTPGKSHYLFNMRDVAKVVQGVLMASHTHMKTRDNMVMLCVHEHLRVYYDRLVDKEDRAWFCENILKIILQHFHSSFEYEELFGNPILFCDFLDGHQEMEDRFYKQAPDLGAVQNILERLITSYNSDCNQKLHLVLFKDAIEHICRACRVLRQSRGHMMLIGVSGCGKQALMKLSAYITKCETFQLSLSKEYKQSNFRDDLKSLYDQCGGVNARSTVFLITDTQISNDSFLEDINNILNTGEVPNHYTSEEMDGIESSLRQTAEEDSVFDNVFGYFLSRVRKNLHIVLCMSPMSSAFRRRIRMFPALINGCTIDWYDQWPADALLSVSTKVLEDLRIADPSSKALLTSMCVDFHLSVQKLTEEYLLSENRKIFLTPKTFLDMIECFKKLLAKRGSELIGRKRMYEQGVEQINLASKEVVSLESSLIELKPLLEVKQVESAELAKEVEADTAEANKVKEIVEVEEREVNAQAQEIQSLQTDAEADLNIAMPMLEEALKAVKGINPGEIAEIRSFATPPPLAVYTLEAIAILFEIPTNWDSIRNMLHHGFLEKLQTFQKDNIKSITLKKLRTKIKNNPNFVPESVGKHNVASKSLCQWVYAIENYASIYKDIEPKRERLEVMNKALEEATENLRVTQEKLEVELERVRVMEEKLHKVLHDKEALDNEVQTTNTRLSRADVLTKGLKDEAVRWEESAKVLENQMQYLCGDTFIAANCISYQGPFPSRYRQKLLETWLQISKEKGLLINPEFSLQKVMADALQVLEWNLATLPTDSTSVDNAILVTNSSKWPLMIDPEEQAKKWVKKMQESGSIKVARQTDKDFARVVDTCIRDGHPLLIEDLPRMFNSTLDTVISGVVEEKDPGRLILRTGDSEIEYDPNFKLYMTTKLANPDYLPDVTIRVSIINFTVTTDGLEEQLLGDIIRREAPIKEAQRIKLIKDIAENEKELRAVENSLLSSLSETNGNILDNAELIKKLDTSKKSAIIANKKITTAQKNREDNEHFRESYKALARRGSLLYFVISDMSRVDPMYQFSLSYFSKLFNLIIAETPQIEDVQDKVKAMIERVSETIFLNVCRGLFNSHKLLFSFLIAVSIMKDEGRVLEEEWDVLLRGASVIPAHYTKAPAPASFSEQMWNFIITLQNISPIFTSPLLGVQINTNWHEWSAWANSENPHSIVLPQPYAKASSFHRLLLLRAFREDKLMYAVRELVREELGDNFVQVHPVTLEQVYAEEKKKMPVIFILSQGADPMYMIMKVAQIKKCTEKLDIISLGKGQEEKAKKAIEKATREGKWVILQNCHLAKSWMPDLDRILENLEDAKAHEDFRIILTSMPFPEFPVPLLQNSMKLTIEPPRGLKTNLERTLGGLNEERMIEMQQVEHYHKMIFALAFFHAVVQERSKFGPLGWNIHYEFNESDFEASVKGIELFLENQEFTWESLRYVFAKIIYGGRVTDKFDRRCLSHILSGYLCPEALGDDYKLSESGIYTIPNTNNLITFKEYVETLPLEATPEVFGMHDNANISYEKRESLFILTSALSIPSKLGKGGGSGLKSEDIVDNVAESFLHSIPTPIMLTESSQEFDNFDALSVFLLQEIDRFNKLISTVKQSLEKLRKALKGQLLMSDELDEMQVAIYNNQVPGFWKSVSYPSLKPLGAWFNNFQQRVKFIRQWLREDKPIAYWLSCFFFPQGFLTAVLQNYARKYHTPIDQISFAFDFQTFSKVEAIEDQEENSVYIYGLYMEGCRWDFETMQLDDSLPGEVFSEAPIIMFVPAAAHTPEHDDYLMPIYKTTQRAGTLSTTGHSTNYIISVECPTSKKGSHWILRGAALICEIND